MPTLRQIELSDIAALFRVRVATDQNCLSLDQLASLGITETSVREKLLGSYKGWLCEVEGEVVGFAIGDRATGELWVIAVLPAYIRQGIGGALLDRVDNWLFSQGCRELWLTTGIDTSLRAYSFYRKHGGTDWKIEAGDRYMKKTSANQSPRRPTAEAEG